MIVDSIPEGFIKDAERWAAESRCDMLKSTSEAWAEAWGAYHTKNPNLPDYIGRYVHERTNTPLDNFGKSDIIKLENDKRFGSDSMIGRNISNIYTGIRSEKPLTAKEKEEIVTYFKKLGVNTDYILFSDVQRTVYNEKHDYFIIGTDVKPKGKPQKGTIYANQRVSIKGTIAHEAIGHREAHLKGWTQANDVYEEVQASIRAARFAPDLSTQERITLLRDARARLGNDVKLKDIKDLLYIKEE